MDRHIVADLGNVFTSMNTKKVWHWDSEMPLRFTKWRIRDRAYISRHSSFKELLVVPAVRVIWPIHNRAIVSFQKLGEYSFLLLNWSRLSLSLARSFIHGFRFGTVSAELSKLAGCPMATCMCKSHPCSRPVWILFRDLRLANLAMNLVPSKTGLLIYIVPNAFGPSKKVHSETWR